MKTRSINSALIMLFITMLFWGCPDLESVEHPTIVATDMSFTSTITIVFEDDTLGYSGVANMAIKLPMGWTVIDTVAYSGASSGIFIFDSLITDSANSLWSPETGYYWWGGIVSDTINCENCLTGTQIVITPEILPDSFSGGIYSIEYRVGDNLEYFDSSGFLHLSETKNIIATPDMTPLSSDVYVSPEGEWGATGTQADPIKTIFEVNFRLVADNTNPGVIHLANGTYSHSATGEEFPIEIANHTSLVGETVAGVILDGEGIYQVLRANQLEQATVSSLTLTNGYGYDGGAVSCLGSTLQLSNVSITESFAGLGGGIYCSGSFTTLNNVTMSGNTGSALFCSVSDVTISNSILAGNSPDEIRIVSAYQNTANISYSNIAGGLDGIVTSHAENLFWGGGNIGGSPEFCDVYLPSYSLAESSPCLAASDIGGYIGACEEVGCTSPVNYPPALFIFPNWVIHEDDTL